MSKDPRYNHDLLARRICGKRAQIDDLASATGLNADTLSRTLRRMREAGYPVVVEEHPIRGSVYSYERQRRRCRRRGCRTVISRYNPSDYCSLHQPKEDLPQEWFLEPNRVVK